MDITRVPAPATAAARAPAAPPGEQTPQSAVNAAAIADRADIRPLDIPAALRILLAEVRAAFELQAIAIVAVAGEPVSNPSQATRALLQMLLGAMPDEHANVPWTAALARIEVALESGISRGIDAVTAWRDVAPSVVDAAREARTLVFAAINDDPPDPVWLRPEWAGLAPGLERFRRRRRLARRLTDPDYSSWSFDDDSEQRT